MPTLTGCMKSIRELVEEKGHGNTLDDFSKKLLFAFVELGEATDIWKKHGFNKTMSYKEVSHGLSIPDRNSNDMIGEELIDVIFYVLDAYGILYRDCNGIKSPDRAFIEKLNKNLKRPYRYGRSESK